MEQRITNKPWGHEVLWAHTKDYVGKILFIKDGCRLSRQYHERKEETIIVLEGTLRLEVGPAGAGVIHLEPGQSFHIEPLMTHRFCADKGDVRLAEVSTPELEDVVRLEDDWGRSS